ncbi:MAG: PP2C family protein-serine/threonine phosphatase [Phycisphaerae bacterium]
MLVVNGGAASPKGLESLVRTGRCRITVVQRCQEAFDPGLLNDVDAVMILCRNGSQRWSPTHDKLLELLHARRVGALVIDGPPERIDRIEPSLADLAPTDISADELWGRLCTLARCGPLVRQIDHELANMRRLGKRLNQHFTELDQQMRLASRLQRDFLPRQLPNVGPARFAALYRPADWISGDIYDVQRVDEDHVAFYVADAVGHGVAAGLLTIFIKQAIAAKRILADRYEILRPSETMAGLNDALTAQQLPNCQFVTACYCLLNCRSLTLSFARGGHPFPIHVGRSGQLTELRTEGGLLGLFAGETFPARSVRLEPGDTVLVFSDGLETALTQTRGAGLASGHLGQQLRQLAALPPQELVRSLSDMLDRQEGSLNPRDDVTLLALQIQQRK